MPRKQSPTVDKERSPPHQPHLSLASTVSGIPADAHPSAQLHSVYPIPGEVSIFSQPTYSQTILQTPTLATDPSILPPQTITTGPSSATSRRQSSSSMRNASMTFENVAPTSTPTGRISKAKKGKRVHACEFPGCAKVFTRAEHRRRHEQNHNPEAMFRCPQTGCGKTFHRLDLLQRHQERHDVDASPSLPPTRQQHSNVYSSPPSVLPSSSMASPPSEAAPRTSSGGLSIGSLVHPPHSQYNSNDSSLGFGMFMTPYPQAVEPYFYGSDGSHSPVSDHLGHYHRPSISSASSVAAFETSSISPTMTTSMPGTWVPATSAPPIVLPSNVFEEGQTSYIPSPTVNAMPVHLRELDGHEFATIQRELSTVPGLIFDSARPELPRYIRSDCLEHYWKYFHPSFPIVYKPNFVTNTPPPLLLSAVLAIGSFYDSRPDAKLYSLALQEIATKLLRQRENITSRSRIADLQTVLLLEILSKYCARHTSPETSARFRALFASLHQTRQILVQSPLAVYKTLSEDKTEDDLKRAHKFWLEHEARRRIFHACSVLDAQQVALFSQRPTIVTHSNVPNRLPDTRGTIDLPCDEELWEASPLEEWSTKAALSIPQDIEIARANYQSASVSDYSFFQHQIINVNSSAKQRCSEEISSPPEPSGALSKTRFNYHVFQMAKHVPVRSLLIVTGESWLLGKKIEQESDYEQAKQFVREWISQLTTGSPSQQVANCIKAHWHALKVLRMVVNIGDPAQPFRSTNTLHEDWSVYLAALVCWAHGYGRTSSQVSAVPEPVVAPAAPPNSRKRKNREMASPPRKRQATLQAIDNAMLAPSSAAHTTQVPYTTPSTAYADTTWAAFDPSNTFTTPWTNHPYYDSQLLAYPTQTDASNTSTAATPTYASSATATALTRTATNTPQSQSSRATTAVPTSAPTAAENDPVTELKAYLSLTDVVEIQHLTNLDTSILSRTRGVLDAVRIHKIGSKRVVAGLMNTADRVLKRLAESRNTDMF